MGKESDVINSWFSPEKSPEKHLRPKDKINTHSFFRNTKSAAHTPSHHEEDGL